MSLLPDGFAGFRGAVTFGLGVVLWVLTTTMAAPGPAGPGLEEAVATALVPVAVGIMVLGPAWYWIGRPTVAWWRRR